jgi:predicted DNA-binding transcriptional regulator AlpA
LRYEFFVLGERRFAIGSQDQDPCQSQIDGWLLLTGRALSRVSMPITSASQGSGVAAGRERRLPHNETDDARVVGSPPARLIFKPEVLHRVGLSFPTIWKLMQLGRFPRARIIGGKSAWIESEISDFIATLPLLRLINVLPSSIRRQVDALKSED